MKRLVKRVVVAAVVGVVWKQAQKRLNPQPGTRT